jgi:hypothetical protein
VIVASSDGTHSAQFWSVDNASNVETASIITFVVDRTAPVTESDAVNTYIGTAAVALVSHDNTGGAGVAQTYFRLDGGVTATGTAVFVSDIGSHTLEFWSVDLAGNVEPTRTAAFVVVQQPATGAQAPLAPSALIPASFVHPAPTAIPPPLLSREGPAAPAAPPPARSSA